MFNWLFKKPDPEKIRKRVEQILCISRYRPFNIVILPSVKEVRDKYKEIYKEDFSYSSFYCPVTKTAYCILNTKRIAHECSHGIINNYFNKYLPRHLDEYIAQWVETFF